MATLCAAIPNLRRSLDMAQRRTTRNTPTSAMPIRATPNSNYEPSPPYGDPNSAAYSDPGYADSSQHDPRYGDPRYADPNAYGAGSVYSDPQSYSDPRYAASYDGQAYDQSQGGYAQESYSRETYPQGSHSPDPAYSNMPSFARPGGGQAGFADPYFDKAPHAGMHMPVPEDHAPARRRGSIVTVLAVLALAVVGTAAAFGYRAMFGSSGTAVPPPVIRADPRPSKVVPVSNDPNAKPIQDRIGGTAERVVPREEAPVDPSRASNPRVIFPNLAEQGQKPGGRCECRIDRISVRGRSCGAKENSHGRDQAGAGRCA